MEEMKRMYSFYDFVIFDIGIASSNSQYSDKNILFNSKKKFQPTTSLFNAVEDNNSLIGKGQYYYFQSMRNKCCIVKPKRGAASDLVFLVSSLPELEQAMNEILGTPILGEMGNRHDSVLITRIFSGNRICH